MQKATQGYTCLHSTVLRGGADVRDQVAMHSCTDACTHYNKGVGLERVD